MPTDLHAVIEAYGAAWAETDADIRLALLDTAWSDAGVYQDPTGEAHGRQELCDHIAGFHGRFPGARLEITSGLDAHHDKLRFGWKITHADGSDLVAGTDFAVLAADGRIASVTGFFGPLPPAA